MSWSSDSGNWNDEEADYGYDQGQTSFVQTYHCYPFAFAGKEYLESGNKILMPMSALDSLASLNISYPMIFEIKNHSTKKASHCGVLEFTAEEGVIFLPVWMMQNLLLQEGDIVTLTNVALPKGSFMKLQPHTSNFLDISNPKETLEKALTNYSCLTRGDTIMITDDNNRNYYIDILETKPSYAISIVDTNCEADFAPPLDYKEPEKPATLAQSSKAPVLEKANFRSSMGIPKRLDGQPSKLLNSPAPSIGHPGFGPNRQGTYKEPENPAASALSNGAPVVGMANSSRFKGMGIPKRLDGQPSKLSNSSTSSIPAEPQRVSSISARSAPTSTPQPSLRKKNMHHPREGPSRMDEDEDEDEDEGSPSQQPPQMGAHKFEPFTGKKYRLDSGSNA